MEYQSEENNEINDEIVTGEHLGSEGPDEECEGSDHRSGYQMYPVSLSFNAPQYKNVTLQVYLGPGEQIDENEVEIDLSRSIVIISSEEQHNGFDVVIEDIPCVYDTEGDPSGMEDAADDNEPFTDDQGAGASETSSEDSSDITPDDQESQGTEEEPETPQVILTGIGIPFPQPPLGWLKYPISQMKVVVDPTSGKSYNQQVVINKPEFLYDATPYFLEHAALVKSRTISHESGAGASETSSEDSSDITPDDQESQGSGASETSSEDSSDITPDDQESQGGGEEE